MLPFWCLHTNIYHLCISMVLLFLSDVQAIFLYLGSSRLLFVMLIFIEIEMFQSASMPVVLKKAPLQALYSTYVVPNNYNKLRREFCGIFLEEQDQNIALLALPSIFSNLLVFKRVPQKLKGKFYRTAIRPAMLYGAECWPNVQQLSIADMRMLR